MFLAAMALEVDNAIDQREESIITSPSYILAGENFRSTLPEDNRTTSYILTAGPLYSQPFSFTISPVSGTSLSCFVRHTRLLRT